MQFWLFGIEYMKITTLSVSTKNVKFWIFIVSIIVYLLLARNISLQNFFVKYILTFIVLKENKFGNRNILQADWQKIMPKYDGRFFLRFAGIYKSYSEIRGSNLTLWKAKFVTKLKEFTKEVPNYSDKVQPWTRHCFLLTIVYIEIQ